MKSVEGFTYTTAIDKLRKLTKRLRIIPGGTSAGKTYGIIPILIDYAIKNPKSEISIVSESVPHLRKGAMRDFLKIMKATNRYIDDHWNRSNFIYTFANDSFIEFFSADQQSKVRGPRRDVLYINECNNIDFETYSQLAIRTRKTIWLDYNPTTEFWVNTELENDTDAEFLTLTYKDNDALSESIVRDIEKIKEKAFHNPNAENLFAENNIKSQYWANWWKVYGCGKTGSIQGAIFSDWSKVDSVPNGARFLGVGIDFGFVADPTAIVELFEYDREIYINELCYCSGMTNGDIANRLKQLGFNNRTLIVADCAEPKSIAEINKYGFSILPCSKGADSVTFGIDLLQQYTIRITSESINVIKEFRNYIWETDKAGNKTNRPIDDFNHAIDAIRYIAFKTLARQNSKARGITIRN